MRKVSQRSRVLAWLEEGNSLTAAEAVERFGVYRLAAIIFDLRAAGHPVQSEMTVGVNRYGERVSFACYCLPPEESGGLENEPTEICEKL